MAKISIPKSEYGVLKDIAELSGESFKELLEGLTKIEPNIDKLNLSEVLSNHVQSIEASDLKAILRTIFSLYRMLSEKEKSPLEIASDIKETINVDKPKDFPFEKSETLEERLQELLRVGGMVAITAKAIRLLVEQERTFCNVSIMSDIRPVFAETVESISAALVTHSLCIGFHQDGQHKEFFTTLTTNELRELKKAVERAEKKAVSLEAFVKNSGVRFLSTTE